MSVESVKAFFEKEGLGHLVHSNEIVSDTVENAAAMIGCEPAQIAKTMSFLLGDGAILIVSCGDAKIDNAKFKAAFHTKAKMVPADRAEELTGHLPGGICPFACKEGVKVYLDGSLKRFGVVYTGGGDEHHTVEVTLPQLERLSGYEAWVDVCKW